MSIRTQTVVDYVRRHASTGPGQWTDAVLRGWLCKRDAEDKLALVMRGEDITAMAAAEERGDGTVHLELLIAEQPWLWCALLRRLMKRWPDWRERRFTAVRHGRLRPFPLVRLIERLELKEVAHGC